MLLEEWIDDVQKRCSVIGELVHHDYKILSISNIVNIGNAQRAIFISNAIFDGMTEEWRKRLEEAVQKHINEHQGSKRSISLKANLDASYVHNMIGGKLTDPTIPRLIAVCEVINVSPSYIISGIEMTREDEELIRYFSELDADGRRIILDMARKILGDTGN